MAIDYVLKSFDHDEHCQTIARITTNIKSNNTQPVAQWMYAQLVNQTNQSPGDCHKNKFTLYE